MATCLPIAAAHDRNAHMRENRALVHRPEVPRAVTREALLDATERMLGKLGYAQLTVEAIGEEAGLARRTVYLYFRGKQEAVLGTIDRIVERVARRLTELAELPKPAPERLFDMLVARVMVRFDSVRDYHHALDGVFAALRPDVLARREAYFATEAGLLATVLRQGQRAGEVTTGNALKTADLLLLCTNALLPHGLSLTDLTDRPQTERRAQAAATLLLDGLCVRTAS